MESTQYTNAVQQLQKLATVVEREEQVERIARECGLANISGRVSDDLAQELVEAASGLQWRTDEQMCELVGEWWLEEMELHNDASMFSNVSTANAMLEEKGSTVRVQGCLDGDDCLEWQLVE